LITVSGRTTQVDQELSAWVGDIRRQNDNALRQLRRASVASRSILRRNNIDNL